MIERMTNGVALLKFILLIACFFLLTGCAGNNLAQKVEHQAGQATVAASPMVTSTATFTRDPTVTPTLTAQPMSTPTARPTSSPTATPLPTHPPAPTDTPTTAPTVSLVETQSGDQVGGDDEAKPVESTRPTAEAQPNRPAADSQTLEAPPTPVSSRTVRVGLHGRNDLDFDELDYQLIREAKIETLKMMGLTKPEVFARIKQDNPDIEFIVRLYDDRINIDGHPTPAEFASKMSPIMQDLQPYVTKFEVGNEPNHVHRYEGWGPDDADAESFNQWFLEVYDLLKTAHPWAELGFPALGTPDSVHRDRAWLDINREAIERADWLGVHCYWQTPPDQASTMFAEDRGLCFNYYHEMFPDKPIELTEFDNDNIVYDLPPISEADLAQEYVTYYQELFKYPYIRSASSFIMSSPDQTWAYFVWRTEDGHFKPVVTAVANMPRPPLIR